MNIDQRNREKTQKYTPFLTDITNYTCTLNCFEVSSTGYINPRNKLTLTTLHSFLKKDMKKSTFLSNLNSLAWRRNLPSLPSSSPTSSSPTTHPSPPPHPTTRSWHPVTFAL